MNNIIVCENISYSYEKKEAVTNVSFNVEENDYLCILGENGTGKSTIVKMLVGLIKPTAGKITYNNMKRTQIGYLPQSTNIDPIFPASVREVVMQGRCEKLGKKFFYSQSDKKIVDEKIKLLGIECIKNKNFSELSGGQKQRVLLARALAATDKLIILDEPVSGLDPLVTAEMYDIIDKLNKESGIAVVMISHDTKSAAKYAKHILHIKNEQLFYGDTKDYVNTELYHEFLGGCGHEHH